MAYSDIKQALANTRDMDCYLEVTSTGEIIQDILSFIPREAELRDHFAAMALQSVITVTSAGQHHPVKPGDELNLRQAMARDAYELADAMLAARKVTP